MTLPNLSVRQPDSVRIAETVNKVLSFDHDSSRYRQKEEILTGFAPADYSYAPYSSGRAGIVCDNVTDESDKVQALFDAAASTTTVAAARVVRLESGNNCIRCDTGVTMDASRVTLDGQGVTLNFENHANAAFSGLKIETSNTDISDGAFRHTVHGVRNLCVQMPDRATVADGYGIEIVDSVDDGSGNYRFPCFTMDNIAIHGGAFGLVFGNGVFAARIRNLTVGSQGGNNVGTAIYAPSPWTDGGEACHVDNVFISNAINAVVLRLGSVYVRGGNIDGCNNIGTIEGIGVLSFNHGYSEFTEGNNDTYKFDCNDANAALEVVNWKFAVRPDLLASRTYAFARNTGVMTFQNVTFVGSNTAWYKRPFLVDGTARVYATGVKYLFFSWCPLVARCLQWLTYPDMDNASALSTFTLSNSGAVSPARVTGQSDGSSTRDVIRFQINNAAASGSYSRALFVREGVIPGKRLSVVGDGLGTLTSSNTLFEVTVTYKDVLGNSVSTTTTTVTSATYSTYTTWGVDGGFVPNGAYSVEVQLQLRATGTVVGNTTFNVSPLGIGYADGQ